MSQDKNAALQARLSLAVWQKEAKQNPYQMDAGFRHSIAYHLTPGFLDQELTDFAEKVVEELEPLVIENNLPQNWPRIEHYSSIGSQVERIVHHPTYEAAGNIIYGSELLKRMSKPGGLLEALIFFFFSSQAGEAGHNCPIACSAGLIRLFRHVEDFPQKSFYLEKLLTPSFSENFTGAQFLTEIQGGSDVGQNATEAIKDSQGIWRITGEKWFCSNADAELILVTARFDKNLPGTKGLGLFLIPAQLKSGERNHYTLRRLKEKIGTCSMATAEIDFQGAYAIPMGDPKNGFKQVMEHVLHISRLFNTFSVLGMGRRAYHIALAYAHNRIAFEQAIIKFPLVLDHLMRIKAENTALLASAFATAKLQDDFDTEKIKGDDFKLLLRLLVNLNKYFSSLLTVEHIHHSLDILAGNGAIESFSTIPRLLRDSLVCENWEGTHNTLRMQLLKDILRYKVDELFLNHLEGDSLDHPKIKEAIDKLKNDLSHLKKASEEVQSLKIKSIMDLMASLYCAAQLFKEEASCPSKKQSLEIFLLTRVEKKVPNDENYLKLISGSA